MKNKRVIVLPLRCPHCNKKIKINSQIEIKRDQFLHNNKPKQKE